MNSYSEWIPLISGFGSTEFLNNIFISVGLSIAFVLAILVAIYFVIFKTNAMPISQTMLLFAAMLVSNINSLRFSTVYPSLLCIAWMQFCLLNRQIFAGFMLLGLGSLFYAPLAWLFILALLFMMRYSIDDFLRTVVKSLCGFLLPHIYLLAFRWISYNDALVYLYHYAQEIIDVSLPFHLLHITDYFLIIVLAYLLLRSIIFFYSKTPDGLPAYIVKTEILTIVAFLALVLCFYDNSQTPLLNMFALPASIILGYYYKNCKFKGRVKAEFIFLGTAIIISLIGGVLN